MRDFADFVVKLMIIDELWESGTISPPHDDAWSWVEAARGATHAEAERLFYGELYATTVPEIVQWARDLDITDEQLSEIADLSWDGGLRVFGLLAPSWDGEDELFDVRTWVDLTPERFPNLTHVTYIGEVEPEVRRRLEAAGVVLEAFS
jgi:hypothetical protein